MDWFNNLVDLIKYFFERYFIPSLVSLLITIIVKYITPEDFDILIKLGLSFYLIGIFLIVFLTVLFIIFLYKKISHKISNYIYENNKQKEILEKNISKMKDYVDQLSSNSKEMIKYFIENDNKPLAYYEIGYTPYMEHDNFLLNIKSTEYVVKDNKESFISAIGLEKISFNKGMRITLYRLPEGDYNLLKYMKENNIGISNFDDIDGIL